MQKCRGGQVRGGNDQESPGDGGSWKKLRVSSDGGNHISGMSSLVAVSSEGETEECL